MTSNEFISLYLAILSANNTTYSTVLDFAETIKIMIDSAEFTKLMVKIKNTKFEETDFVDHQYTTYLDQDTGAWCFEINQDDQKEIFKNHKEEISILAKAIQKLEKSKEIKEKSNGRIKMAYDDSNGVFSLDLYDEPLNRCETRLYTDGVIKDLGTTNKEEPFHLVRDVKVSKSTYTILVDYRNNVPLGAEIRGFTTTNFEMVYEEAKRLMMGLYFSYDENIKQNPKAYKFKRN